MLLNQRGTLASDGQGGGGGVQAAAVMGVPVEQICCSQAPLVHWASEMQPAPRGTWGAQEPDVGDVVSHHAVVTHSSRVQAPPWATLVWQWLVESQ